MSKKGRSKGSNVVNLIKKIMIEIEQARPTKEEMLQDLKLMNLKVRPIVGDIFMLNSGEHGLLETLWRIGKIEEIFMVAADTLGENERGTLFKYLESVESQSQRKIKDAIENLTPIEKRNMKLLKLEVIRKRRTKRDIH